MPDLPLVERRPASAASRNAAADKFLADITTLLPDIRARAEQTERLGVLADDIVQALTDAGVFRAVQPRQWGGLELDHATFYEGMVLIASACGATGWVASVVGVHPWQVALFANEAQREVWGAEPDARIARPWRLPARSGGWMAASTCPVAGIFPAASIIAGGCCWARSCRTRAAVRSSARSLYRAGISRSTMRVGR
jgi:3-hydroxy-9,10-secoandrosta-1,3,5(10)-triene-9,17-dione monooxygenase